MKRQLNGKPIRVKAASDLSVKAEKSTFLKKLSREAELICSACESPGAKITCSGECMRSFHLECIGELPSEGFICTSCSSGKFPCFSCKKDEGILKKCSVSACGKYYHADCLRQYNVIDKEKFTCPLHLCLTCKNNNKNQAISKNDILQCIRCPTAFHNRDECVAAGCKQLAQSFLLCPDHYEPVKNKQFHTVTNIPWCSICTLSGKLQCCECCSAAFHEECATIQLFKNKCICNDCAARKFLQYGSIVWAKIGSFRWWPARVLNVKDLPSDMKQMDHSVGEFCIQYFGTNDHFWTHKGRVYPYFPVQEDLVTEITKHPSALETKYKASIEEANVAFEEWSEEKSLKAVEFDKPRYKHIKTNRPVGKVQVHTIDMSSLASCVCDPKSSSPCSYTSDCLNRSVLVECHPSVCKAGERCQNQMFQKRQYAKITPFKTKTRGWALKALEDIKEGEFIIEYVGDLIDEEECQRRLLEKHKNDDKNYYFLTIDKDCIIDAGPRGNLSRFMNHSCSPNCETQKWIVNGETRVGIFAKYPISAGNELTFDYMMDSLNNSKLKCLCGSQNCRGAIGVTQNPLSKTEQKMEKVKQKKRSVKQNQQVKLGNKKCCFLCNKQGKLISCSMNGCLKSYHISCLGRSNIPSGRWQCPWHHCDTCGRLSKYMCSKCTNSFCDKHKTVENMSLISGFWLCLKHSIGTCSDAMSAGNNVELVL